MRRRRRGELRSGGTVLRSRYCPRRESKLALVKRKRGKLKEVRDSGDGDGDWLSGVGGFLCDGSVEGLLCRETLCRESLCHWRWLCGGKHRDKMDVRPSENALYIGVQSLRPINLKSSSKRKRRRIGKVIRERRIEKTELERASEGLNEYHHVVCCVWEGG